MAIMRSLAPAFCCLAISAACPAAAETAGCPSERAVYTLESGGDTFTIALVPARSYASMASDLYFKLTTTQRSYWFSLAMSQGYGGMTLLPVGDPYDESARNDGPRQLLDDDEGGDDLLPSLRFYTLDASLAFIEEPPAKGEPAPAHVMAPELGLALWYNPALLSEDAGAERDPMPRGIFRLTTCLDAAPPKAWP